ncbi:Transcriptional regulator [Fructobacillus fructosus]|uniref:Contains XRE-family HTH domain (HipB) n=3 Tax=Fructobacillus fructosus TaxID=1631 RepID=A0ABN9YJC9_9LACO|nr:Transcriptional regulator [Fructobacillus fructosus]CAK1234539.1 Transcriptional regulator [Fructobacillus fructosus]
MTLLSRTKEMTKKRGLTIEMLAKEIGIAKSGIYQWDKHEPKPSVLDKTATVLGVSTDYLLGRTNQMNSYDSKEKVTNLEDTAILAFDGKPIDEEDRQKLLQYARFIMQEREQEGQ